MTKCQQISVPEWATDFLGPGDRNSVTFPRVDSTSDSTDSREMVSSWAGPQETASLSRVNPPNLWHGQFDNCRYTSVPQCDPCETASTVTSPRRRGVMLKSPGTGSSTGPTLLDSKHSHPGGWRGRVMPNSPGVSDLCSYLSGDIGTWSSFWMSSLPSCSGHLCQDTRFVSTQGT